MGPEGSEEGKLQGRGEEEKELVPNCDLGTEDKDGARGPL
jgi:hypothetical protein